MIQRIGIIGEGKMGTSLFLYLTGFDFRLRWLCHSDTGKERAQKSFNKKLKVQLQSGVMTDQEYAAKLDGALITTESGDLADCDLIIEAISEDITQKRALFHLLCGSVNPACIFTTNSSSILPSQLIPAEKRKDKMAGMHFFFPVALKKTVELITTEHTSEKTKQALQNFLQSIDKDIFLQEETNAFILNRLFLDFQAGAYEIVMEGKLSYQEMDTLVKEKFFPAGVFEFFDHVGIDVMLASVRAYTQNSENKRFYSPLIGKMEELVSQNKLGIKTKQGFYDYLVKADHTISGEGNANQTDGYLQYVERKLRDHFVHSFRAVMDTGIISGEKLSAMVADYTGTDCEDIYHFIHFMP